MKSTWHLPFFVNVSCLVALSDSIANRKKHSAYTQTVLILYAVQMDVFVQTDREYDMTLG